jgi:hypothetical protein
MSKDINPSVLTLRALMRRLAQHEPDIHDEIERTFRAQENRVQREKLQEWREGSQRLVRALRAFQSRNPHRHWEDYADLGGRGRYAGSIGLAMSFLAGGGPGGVAPKDLTFVKKVVDSNDPPTQVNDLSRLLGAPLAKESEHTVLLALYLAGALGTNMFIMNQRDVDKKAREYSKMLNDKYAEGWRHNAGGGKRRTRMRVRGKLTKGRKGTRRA